MAIFVLRRVTFFVGALALASLLIFALIRLAGGNVAAVVLGADASPEAIDALAHQYGFDRPLQVQYAEWIGEMLRGDLGRSFVLTRVSRD